MRNLILITLLLTGCGKKITYVEGLPGLDGNNGQDGQGCFMDYRIDGDYVICGEDETKVADSYDQPIVELVVVCPNVIVSMPETFIKVGNQYLAFLSSSNYHTQRLVVLPENTLFQTTDGRSILFTISNGELVYTTPECN